MMDQKDTYRAAQIVIDQHGADAENFALEKVNMFMEKQDVVAASAWLLIAQAIEQLKQVSPEKSTIH